uniref:Leucine-rich repeat-containing protein let-4 n=1 Tax=Syphacia muris TaxID=451379 RepID=A0A0N5ATT6_9BILA
MLLYYSLSLSVLLYIATFANGCPQFLTDVCHCENLNNGVNLDCTNVPITKRIVELLKSNRTNIGLIQELKLKRTQLRYLPAKYFVGLYIKKLDLSNNQLDDINPAAFDGLNNVLEELIIQHNNLTSLPTQAITSLHALKRLDLSNNSINDLVADDTLPPVPKLYDLSLADNHICEVHKSVFDNVKNSLQTLNLGRNCLRSVPASAIRGFKKLKALHLHGNNITALNLLSFMNLPVLSLLNLASNKIAAIHRQAFLNVPLLKYLYLSGNQITKVYPHQFSSFEQLEMLDLSENSLTEIVTDAFSNLQHLRQLYLAENHISNIKPDSFTNSSVAILSLASNQLTELEENVFDGMPKLQQLSLKDNKIQSIAQNIFYNCPNLAMIDLSENDLTNIAPTTFLTQTSILLIDLSRNKIARTPYGAFNRKTKTVLLQENPLVCTEKIHMLQGGVGVYIPNSEDIVCGEKKSTIPKTYTNDSNYDIEQLTTPTNRIQVSKTRSKITPTQPLSNRRMQHIQTIRPPVIKPLTYSEYEVSLVNSFNIYDRKDDIKPPSRIANTGKLSIRPLPSNPTDEKMQQETQQPNASNEEHESNKNIKENVEIITSRSRGNFGFSKPRIHVANPNNNQVTEAEQDNDGNKYKKAESNKPYPQPIPFFNNPTPLAPAFPAQTGRTANEKPSTFAITEESETTTTENGQRAHIKTAEESSTKTEAPVQTLPPNIVVAQDTLSQTSMAKDINAKEKQIEKMELESDGINGRRYTTPQTSKNAYDTEYYNRRDQIATPTIIMILCLSTVAIVMSSVFVGLCVAKHRRLRLYADSTTSSAAAARTNAYVAAQAAQAAQMNILYGSNGHRNRGSEGPLVVEQLKKNPLEIRELYLENANIVQIGRYAFRNLRIKKLVLDNNRIRALHPDAFRGLESVMQELSISHNKLTQVPTDALIGMRALSIISFRCNQIGDINTPLFRNVSNLIDLDLGCNSICNIEGPDAFSDVRQTLQNLILDNNCMKTIPIEALKNLDNLIGLHIKYNQIEKLEKGQLNNLTSLALLTLTGNQINTIETNIMDDPKNLKYLFLGSNKISKLLEGALGQFNQVQVIDLSYNEISEITVDMFSGLENLQNLNLEGNGIKDIAPGAFATTPLLLLWLPKNCLTSVTTEMFQGAPFLRQVSLAHNNIRTIQPLSFAHLANLHTLDLSYNKLEVVQQGEITGSNHLTVRLQENPMVCSQDGFHVMNGRQAISLTSEPNLICKTDYTKDDKDVCPKKSFEKPKPSFCCEREKAKTKQTTPAAESTTTEIISTTTDSTITSTLTDIDSTTDMKSTEASEPQKKLQVTKPIVGIAQPTPNNNKYKKFNMARFIKLSRRPNAATDIILKKTENSQINTPILSVTGENVSDNKHIEFVTKVTVYLTATLCLNLIANFIYFFFNLFLQTDRPVPSRVSERVSQMKRTKFPPWIRNQAKDKNDKVDFSSDSRVETVQVQDSSAN